MTPEEIKNILDKHRNDSGYRADLREADLHGANLREADLRGTMLDRLNWLAWIGISPSSTAHAYKMTAADGKSPIQSGNKIDYLAAETFVEPCDSDVDLHCGRGINLANLEWCLNNKADGYRLFLMEFDTVDAVCPRGSDGKFRVSKCWRIAECDWNGNIIPAAQGK